MRLTRRAFLWLTGVAFTVPLFQVKVLGVEPWSGLLTEAQMLNVVDTQISGRGRYRFEGQVYSQWFPHKHLLRKLRGVFPAIPITTPLLQVQRESDSEFIEIQRVAA